MEHLLFLLEEAGRKKDIHKLAMSKKSDKNYKLTQVIKILKYSLSLDDEEILRSTVESVIEILEEELPHKI